MAVARSLDTIEAAVAAAAKAAAAETVVAETVAAVAKAAKAAEDGRVCAFSTPSLREPRSLVTRARLLPCPRHSRSGAASVLPSSPCRM